MEFTRRFPNPPSRPPHEDTMMVTRDALLSQLQKDRLRQEIIVAELAAIERAMALRSAASHRGTASSRTYLERANPAVPFAFDEQFVQHGGGAVVPEHHVGEGEARDLKKEDGVHGGVRIKSETPAVEDDLVRECSKTSGSNDKLADQENVTTDECKRESDEAVLPEKTLPSPSVKWRCTICQVEASSESNLLQHFAGQKHRVNMVALKAIARSEKLRKARKYAGKPGPTWVCKFCPANCTVKSILESHLNGKKHLAKIQALFEECNSMVLHCASGKADSNPNMVTQDEEKPDSVSFCGVCQVKCTNPFVRESHVRGKKHQMNLHALKLEAKRLGIVPPKVAKKQQAPPEWDCTICQAKCNSEAQLHDHCRSMGHQQKIDEHSSGLETGKKLSTDDSVSNCANLDGGIQKVLYFCKLCDLQCNSKNTLAEHRRGKKHLEKVEKRMLSSFCNVCSLQCNSEKMLAHHCTGSKHQANLAGC